MKTNKTKPLTLRHVSLISTNSAQLAEVQSETVYIKDIFQPITTLLKWCGKYMDKEGERRTTFQKIRAVYCISMSVFVWLDLGRCMTVFVYHPNVELSDKFLTLCVYVVFFILIAYMLTSTMYSTSRYYQNFINVFTQYQLDYGLAFSSKKAQTHIQRFVNIFYVVDILNLFINGGMLVYYLEVWPNSLTSATAIPFNLWTDRTKYYPVFIILVLRSFAITAYTLDNTLYYILCYIFWREYKGLAKEIDQLSQQSDPLDFKTSFEHLRQKHDAITRVLMSANPIIHHAAYGMFAAGIPIICFAIFGLIRRTVVLIDFVASMNYLVYTVFGIVTITAAGACVNAAAHEPLASIFRVDFDEHSDKTLHQVNLFATRLTGPPIGVDVYGLFIIDRSSILMLLGTIVTYIVVVLQM